MVKFAAGDADRITGFSLPDVRVSHKTVWRHIVLETADGMTGHGEYTFDNPPADISRMAGHAARSLTGARAVIPSLEQVEIPNGPAFAAASIRSALDQALTDIEARRAGLPIGQYLGAHVPSTVSCYANINRRTVERTPAGFAKSAGAALADGFTAIKIAPFDGLSPENCDSEEGKVLIRDGFERIFAVAGKIGRSAALMVDCHWRFTTLTALDCISPLAEAGVSWFECPIPEKTETIDDLLALRRASNARNIQLTGLEKATCWEELKPFVEAGAYDVIMPDIKHAGGFAGIGIMSAQAKRYGTRLSLHNPTGPIAHLASLQMSAALGGGELLEFQFDESPLFRSAVEPPPRFSAGRAIVPTGPGLGAALVK